MKKLGLALIVAVALLQTALADEATWLTDFAKAQAAAKQNKKMVLMDFTGSDWCPPCKLLHKNVLTSKEFVDFAKDNLVLVLVDFPTTKKLPAEQQKANEKLAQKFKVSAFPTVIVLDSEGKQVSSEVGYEGASAKEFVANLQKLKKRTSS
jgi:protein disulfide-isomerase